MNRIALSLLLIITASCTSNAPEAEPTQQETSEPKPTAIPQSDLGYNHKAMVFGTFHFNRNTDGSDVIGNNILDVTTEESQELLENITDRIVADLKPTIVAIEFMPELQPEIDSLYQEYLAGSWELGLNESFQIGFRVAKKMGLEKVHCVDNRPPQPESVATMDDWEHYADSLQQLTIIQEYDSANALYNSYVDQLKEELNVVEFLQVLHSSENLKRSKELWLTGLINLGQGDNFAGADLTGHWYQRNARIFVKTRNLCKTKHENVLVIYGNAHKWILDEYFNSSPEFELMQPHYQVNSFTGRV